MAKYLDYHKSLTDELHALKDRIRNLVEDRNWQADGEHKEAALRSILRRHLPESLMVGRGFVVTPEGSSTQIDILIVDRSKPTLFKDGDLLFVTPDCVKAVIEVKTSSSGLSSLREDLEKLGKVGDVCRNNGGSKDIWYGLFCYEGEVGSFRQLLDAVQYAYGKTGTAVNALAYGRSCFVRFWEFQEQEAGEDWKDAEDCRWRAYQLENLASAYFIGNVIGRVTELSEKHNSRVWYPLKDGKRAFMLGEKTMDNKNI